MRFYVGCHTSLGGPGIAVCALQGGWLRVLSDTGGITDPIWLVISGDTLYAACTGAGGGGAVASFHAAGDSLELLSVREAGGAETCHLALDARGRFLYAANYASGSLSVLPLMEGHVLPPVQLIVHSGGGPSLPRQDAAHTHQLVFRPGTLELFVTDLGMDRVFIYRADPETGLLSETGRIACRPGSGPRHLAFAGGERFYLAGELDNTLSVFDLGAGGWRERGHAPTLPAGFTGENTAAALRVAGGRAYVSNRGHDSIALFALAGDGLPIPAGHLPAHGKTPRDFAVLPYGSLLIATISGSLAHAGPDGSLLCSLPLPGAVCVLVP